jgi:hemerythrin-like domain-containing protein
MGEAVRVILREHGSIGSVLHGLKFLAQELRARRASPDFALLRSMVHYIDAFPERLHHPKEDRYLFRRLRERTHEADEALDRLEEQHARGAQLTRDLESAIERYATDGESALEPFAQLVEQYTRFYWNHMREEEEQVLPVAQRVLTADDWREIDAAFARNEDPLGGGEDAHDFRALFHRIAMLAPAPIGLGAAVREEEE